MLSTEKNNDDLQPPPANTPRLFISDVHLGAFSVEINRKLENDLIGLIDFCEKNQLQIVILGDFFDYWMEYSGNPPPIGQAILHRFEKFHRETGSHTLYITGNHDNWTGDYFSRIGFDVEHEYRIIQDSDIAFMIMHGDGLQDPGMNLPRPLMHRFLRNSYFITLYQALLPSKLGWQIMKLFSGLSKMTNDAKKSSVRGEALDSWVRDRVRNDDSIQAIIYGHHHRPILWKERENICMNCGYFGKDGTVGLYTNRNFQIVIWDAGNKVLSEYQILQSA